MRRRLLGAVPTNRLRHRRAGIMVCRHGKTSVFVNGSDGIGMHDANNLSSCHAFTGILHQEIHLTTLSVLT